MKFLPALVCAATAFSLAATTNPSIQQLAHDFATPPLTSRPGVYWYFMDGNLSKVGATRDLEAMRAAGIGYAVFLEVNVGVPRGKVNFMSPQWIDFFKHLVKEAERCDVQIILGIGPGWCGSGGPWVKGEKSMRHLVSSETTVEGGRSVKVQLATPVPRDPFFGIHQFPPAVRAARDAYYEDVAVLAFPASRTEPAQVKDVDEKAHVYRAPYSSRPGVKQYLPCSVPSGSALPATPGIDRKWVVDLTKNMAPDGTLTWKAPAGRWTILRFGARNNGAITRPAPLPGVGFECDKFSETALRDHLAHFTDRLFAAVGERPNPKAFGGIKYLHLDSWEMGAQNWTDDFRAEFTRRRGYDPLPFYPAYAGYVVGDATMTERFLWDLRQTSQELIIEKHVKAVKRYARQHGCQVSCEPYDMNPIQDLELAAASDLPMAEFWRQGFGYNTSWTPFEASSVAHLIGQGVVPAESFTAANDGWRPHPATMKSQTDWALSAGITRFIFHTFQHQPLDESKRPGMTMGPYGVHWDRNQTWWPMARGYHSYLMRCQHLLQQGRVVSDILYVNPEGNPHVFRAPASALVGADGFLPDKRGYGFDACPPSLFDQIVVKDGRLVFPSGATYRVAVLPDYGTMTPQRLRKVRELLLAGATVVGLPPRAAPGLTDYPACDDKVRALVEELWGTADEPERHIGKGRLVRPKAASDKLYQNYNETAQLLAEAGVAPDFEETSGELRNAHRTAAGWDLYFVSSRADRPLRSTCTFRAQAKRVEVWDALTGARTVAKAKPDGARTKVELSFAPNQSFFVVFFNDDLPAAGASVAKTAAFQSLEGAWKVAFQPPVGAAFTVTLPTLVDWSKEADLRLRYFSGIATYTKTFDCAAPSPERIFLSLGTVKNMARIRLNGHDLGVQWTEPWRVEVTGLLQPTGNRLEIEVANLWTNRLVGDERVPPAQRTTFTTRRPYKANSALEPSGLMGPVRLEKETAE